MRRNNIIFVIGVTSVLLFPKLSFSCGVCEKDDLAAVYDFQAAENVRNHPERLEYVVVKVKGSLSDKKTKAIISWLSSRKGVDAATVKISTTQRSIGFVLNRNFDKHKLVKDLGETFRDLTFESKKVELSRRSL